MYLCANPHVHQERYLFIHMTFVFPSRHFNVGILTKMLLILNKRIWLVVAILPAFFGYVTHTTKDPPVKYCEIAKSGSQSKFHHGNTDHEYFLCTEGEYFNSNYNPSKSGPIGCTPCERNYYTKYRNWCPACDFCFVDHEGEWRVENNDMCRGAVLPTTKPSTIFTSSASGGLTTVSEDKTSTTETPTTAVTCTCNKTDVYVLVGLLVIALIALFACVTGCTWYNITLKRRLDSRGY